MLFYVIPFDCILLWFGLCVLLYVVFVLFLFALHALLYICNYSSCIKCYSVDFMFVYRFTY